MATLFSSILSPMPASISMTPASLRTSSGRIPSVMRFLSSAGDRFSQSGFGTTPNMAPPSRRKKPSKSGVSSNSPNCILAAYMLTLRRATARSLLDRKHLLELHQHTVRAGGMNERHERPVRAWTGSVVNQSNTALLQPRERSDDIVDPQRDVVKPWTALRRVLGDRRGVVGRLQKFKRRFTGGNEMRPHPLRRNVFRRLDL